MFHETIPTKYKKYKSEMVIMTSSMRLNSNIKEYFLCGIILTACCLNAYYLCENMIVMVLF